VRPDPAPAGDLRTEDLSAGYPGRPVLDGVSVTLTSGRRTALLGANGCGKTTLLRCLSGAHRPGGGRVVVGERPLRHSRGALNAHRRIVQLVLQDPDDQLFSAEVTQDISFGPMNMGLPEDEVRDRVAEAIDLLGIGHLADRPTHQLSYGERKRVAVAGAMAMRPQWLLLDEPTAGLDPRGEDEMLAAIGRLEAYGTTVVMATHDVALALAWASDAVVVTGGRSVQGPVTDLLADPDLLAAAHLRMPWPLVLARRCGWPVQPRDLDEVLAVLRLV